MIRIGWMIFSWSFFYNQTCKKERINGDMIGLRFRWDILQLSWHETERWCHCCTPQRDELDRVWTSRLLSTGCDGSVLEERIVLICWNGNREIDRSMLLMRRGLERISTHRRRFWRGKLLPNWLPLPNRQLETNSPVTISNSRSLRFHPEEWDRSSDALWVPRCFCCAKDRTSIVGCSSCTNVIHHRNASAWRMNGNSQRLNIAQSMHNEILASKASLTIALDPNRCWSWKYPLYVQLRQTVRVSTESRHPRRSICHKVIEEPHCLTSEARWTPYVSCRTWPLNFLSWTNSIELFSSR